ncbi:ChaN family lipoprotein [Temperatibacter marinus]|uniref:ChaN family lipoprotein n=1 Tax=Temperatibacter marinus TaxID=1456591 RepID=A0AA52EJ15_9PROT|nr:ChaN family lipoprotein [Temperatibacter marinus]WND02936.1 ChaN family lipoprotein [Temperatibacter marinus]
MKLLQSLALALTCITLPVGGVETNDHTISGQLGGFYDFKLIHTDGGKADPKEMSIANAAEKLKDYDVIFFGENHRHPGNHLAQALLFEALYRQNQNLTLSMEQFNRDKQPVVDAYLKGEIGEWTLRTKGEAWDNYLTSYRPLVEFAKENKLPVIAAEVPIPIVVCVGKEGLEILDTLPQPDRGWAAKTLNLQTGSAYFNKYMKFAMGSSTHGKPKHGKTSHGKMDQGEKSSSSAVVHTPRKPHSTGSSQANSKTPRKAKIGSKAKIGGKAKSAFTRVMNSYAGQVLRDDTMAESIALHLKENEGRQVMHLDGAFHSDDFMGTVERLKLRMPELKIAVIAPKQMKDKMSLTLNENDVKAGTFILMINSTPKGTLKPENEKAFVSSVIAKRKSNQCPYGKTD